LNQAVIELGKNYADTQRTISNLKNDEEKYQNTIEQSLAVINKYTPQQREEIRNYVQQGRAITDMTLKKRELLTAEDDLKRSQVGLLSTQAKLIDENGNFNASITQIAQGVIDQQVELSTLANINADFAESVRVQVEAIKEEKQAIEARNKAIELAQKAFTAYDIENEQVLNGIIKMSKGHEDSAYWAELNRLATEKLNEVIIANGAETDKVDKILDNHAQGMESITNYAIALGDSYDANSEKASLLTSTIKALVDIGIDPESEAVADLVAQLNSLTLATEEATGALGNSAVEAFKKSAQSRADAYKEIDSYRQSDYSKEMQAIREKAEAFLKAGVEEVDVAEWQSEQWDRIHKAQADKAEEEAKRARDAWIGYAFDVGGSIASMWSLINQVQANQNEEELNRIRSRQEEELNILTDKKDTELALLKEKLDNGIIAEEAYEKAKEQIDAEYTASKDAQEAELDSIKKKYAEEEAKRKKAQGTFQAIIDTASAVIGFLANPGGFAGVGLSAMAVGVGAAQIAAINSAPVPSYDVGSIRIPETTQAVVHKDEMILTAPQAEQARREGITIAPTTKTSGSSVNLVIYLDGKEIARNTIDNLNSGSVGTIKARVVK